ncbi:MAG TPA: hypothetical protein VKB93_28390 [Thermoanaerobaculia bacterium]|nr:hypothetical protein [Thermoanaerobaculia bacterium]
MPFPSHIESILTAYGVRPDTKAALYDLYVSLGDEVLEVFGDLAEGVASVTDLRPEDTVAIRGAVVERYLRRNHPRWLAGVPTPSLWHPRAAEGRASGAAVRLGERPHGILMLGRNAHYGGRSETISFDIVARELEDAIAIAKADGQQHTLPGSVGETSGTFDSVRGVALIWEVQPNVYKPQGERNRAIAKLYRRHRNWHVATLTAALEWLRAQGCAIFILRGNALAIAHEVNPAKPVSDTIASLHDRTVEEVVRALDGALQEPAEDDELVLLDSVVLNHALRKHVLASGAASEIWKFVAL